MDKIKHIIISLSVIFISLVLIDGGKTLMHIGIDIKIFLNQEHKSDLEIPHQHIFNKSTEGEKWIKSNAFELYCAFNNLVFFLYNLKINSQDYTGSIWQPPKSL
jgi:hypothetical protein